MVDVLENKETRRGLVPSRPNLVRRGSRCVGRGGEAEGGLAIPPRGNLDGLVCRRRRKRDSRLGIRERVENRAAAGERKRRRVVGVKVEAEIEGAVARAAVSVARVAVIAGLARLLNAVTADLVLARARAAVVVGRVVVVALLARLLDAIATDLVLASA